MGGTLKRWLEPVLTLAGIYAVQFLLTRAAAATVPALEVVKPIKGFAAWLFTGWDAEHYLRLAQNYDSYAWPPLYPMLLRAVAALGPNTQAAAVLVNLLAHFVIVLLAFEFVRGHRQLQDVPGWLFASLLLFFPGHNVFFAAYSESVFLALVLASCVAYQRDQLLLAGVLCGLSLLARNMGVFLGAALLAVELMRGFNGRRLAAVSCWLLFFAGWNLWLARVAGTDPVAATNAWQVELLEHHVPAGENPKLWVLRFIALPPGNHFEFVFFWGSIAAALFSWLKGLRVEAMFIVFFLLSFAFYLYRPFPFTRYTSVLFPLALMVAFFTRRAPALQFLVLGVCVALSHFYEVMLFSQRFGEP